MDHFNYNNFYFPYSNISNMNTYMSKQKQDNLSFDLKKDGSLSFIFS